MPAPRHLVSVWNPSYADGAMDAHLDVLLRWAARWEKEEVPDEEVYVWWAKLRSPNRQQPLPHAADVLALDAQAEAGVETHLYLTDYRSLYVGDVARITADDVLTDPGEQEHAPAYYRGQAADFWFQLTDLRRLVADDTRETIEVLKGLRNVHYNGRPVSLYGGMVNLPLVVFADPARRYFDETADEALIEGGLWAQHDAAQHGEVGRMHRELRDHLIGRGAWAALQPATRGFLAGAEAVLRPRIEDARFDFSPAVIGYAKAIEVELNAILWPMLARALKSVPEKDRLVRIADERLVDPVREAVPHQTLGSLRRLLAHDDAVRHGLKIAAPAAVNWWTLTLPDELRTLAGIRNAGAHTERVSLAQALELRAAVLGVGCRGVVVGLAEGQP